MRETNAVRGREVLAAILLLWGLAARFGPWRLPRFIEVRMWTVFLWVALVGAVALTTLFLFAIREADAEARGEFGTIAPPRSRALRIASAALSAPVLMACTILAALSFVAMVAIVFVLGDLGHWAATTRGRVTGSPR